MAGGGELLGEVGGGEPEEAGISGNLVVLLATIVMSWNWITLDLFREESFVRISTTPPPWPHGCPLTCLGQPLRGLPDQTDSCQRRRQCSPPVLRVSAPH